MFGCRFRRRNSSLENLNELLANDGLSNKPKEDRIVKFKDEPERGRSRSRFRKNNPPASGAKSILKDPKKSMIEAKKEAQVGAEVDPDGKDRKDTTIKTEEDSQARQEESGYDSDLTPRGSEVSGNKSDPESPGSSRISMEKVEELGDEKLDDSDNEKDLSLESIITNNGALIDTTLLRKQRKSQEIVSSKKMCVKDMIRDIESKDDLAKSQPIYAVVNKKNKKNVTHLQVDYEQTKFDTSVSDNEEELSNLLLTSADEAPATNFKLGLVDQPPPTDGGSVVSVISSTPSIPMDFGESLPPTLTNLMNKQFR